jgi:antitoxin component YwqK of YwqJK toxin-antitoxin module
LKPDIYLMIRIPVFLLFFLIAYIANSQTYNVFKGDTINRTDSNGKKQGLWKKYYKNDTLFSEGVYKNGVHTGTFRTYYRNGKPQSILNFRGTSETSFAELFFEDGTIMSRGKYIDHNKDSLWTYYDEKGNKKAEEFYKNGFKDGISKTYYTNGQPSQIVQYKKDIKQGPYKEFFDSGNPKIEATMFNDEFDGDVIIFHPNKQVWQKGKYLHGVKDGKWIVNKEDGSLEKEEIYDKGFLKNDSGE